MKSITEGKIYMHPHFERLFPQIYCIKLLQNSHDWGEGGGGEVFVECIRVKKSTATRKKIKILMLKMLLITENTSWSRESAL